MVTHSSRRITPSHFIAAAVVLFLISPYLILVSRFGIYGQFDYSEIRWAINNSIVQGIFSALIATIISVPLALGLLRAQKTESFLRYALMLPSFLPPLFVLLSFLEILDPFPIGNIGVSIILGFTISGLLSIQIKDWLQSNIGGMIETAETLGASKARLRWLTIQMLKPKLLNNFFLTFCYAFTSFSIPLVVGGGRGTNLEILIYEKMRISGNWPEALALSLVQTLFLFAFSAVQIQFSMAKKFSNLKVISMRTGWVLCWLYFLFFIFPFIFNFADGYFQAEKIPGLLHEAKLLASTTAVAGVFGGMASVYLLVLTSYTFHFRWVQKILNGFVPPSTALVGVSIIIIAKYLNILFLYILGFLLLTLTTLYRLGFSAILQKVSAQVETAQALGANHFLIWKKIILPQIRPAIFHFSGIVSFWIVGDFALAKIVYTKDATLAMLIHGLMESYRIDSAIFLSTFLILIGSIVYFIFWSLAYVARRRT